MEILVVCLLYNFTFIAVLSQPLFALFPFSVAIQTALVGMEFRFLLPPTQSVTHPSLLTYSYVRWRMQESQLSTNNGTYFFRTITLRILSFAAYPLTRPIVSSSSFTHYNAHWLAACSDLLALVLPVCLKGHYCHTNATGPVLQLPAETQHRHQPLSITVLLLLHRSNFPPIRNSVNVHILHVQWTYC